MRAHLVAGFVPLVFALATAISAAETSPTDLVLQRYREQLLAYELPTTTTVQRYVDEIQPDGTWSDINYSDGSSGDAWRPQLHLARTRTMAHALVNPRHPLYEDAKLRAAVLAALDHWLAKRYQNPNWWWNRIGVPEMMRDLIVLLGDRLEARRRTACLEVVGQYSVGGTGANLAWTAGLALHYGCLTHDAPKVADAAERIWNDMNVGSKEGIQSDWSFYQHRSHLQSFHYGREYLDVVCAVAWQLRGTPWQIPPEKRDVITNYLLEGLQWMSRGKSTVPGTVDRMVTRQHGLRANLALILEQWQQVHPERKDELAVFFLRQQGRAEPITGFRHFPYGDFSAYHRPKASVFLKTISSRTLPTELMNGENLKGVPYLNSGDHYLVADGQEYDGLQPVWIWSELPGLTLGSEPLTQQRVDFVGGLGNGPSGLTAMDYVRSGDGASLKVRKLWAFHEDLVVCLLGGWEITGSLGEIRTSLEQCRLRDGADVAMGDGSLTRLREGDQHRGPVQWILHHGIGYLPLVETDVDLHLTQQRGAWGDINRQYGKEEIALPVFRMALDHGPQPKPGGFALVLAADADRLQKLHAKPAWEVLKNSAECQSLRFTDGPTMAAFYAAAGEAVGDLQVNKPCLALWTEDRLWLCDPTQQGTELAVTWKGTSHKMTLPAHAGVVEIDARML